MVAAEVKRLQAESGDMDVQWAVADLLHKFPEIPALTTIQQT